MVAVRKGMTYRASNDPSGWGMFEMNFHAAGKTVLALEDASAAANSVKCLCTCCGDTVSVDPTQLTGDNSSDAQRYRQRWARQQQDHQQTQSQRAVQPPKASPNSPGGYTGDEPERTAGCSSCLALPLLPLIWVLETLKGLGKRLRIGYLLLLLGLLCFPPLQIAAVTIGIMEVRRLNRQALTSDDAHERTGAVVLIVLASLVIAWYLYQLALAAAPLWAGQ